MGKVTAIQNLSSSEPSPTASSHRLKVAGKFSGKWAEAEFWGMKGSRNGARQVLPETDFFANGRTIKQGHHSDGDRQPQRKQPHPVSYTHLTLPTNREV